MADSKEIDVGEFELKQLEDFLDGKFSEVQLALLDKNKNVDFKNYFDKGFRISFSKNWEPFIAFMKGYHRQEIRDEYSLYLDPPFPDLLVTLIKEFRRRHGNKPPGGRAFVDSTGVSKYFNTGGSKKRILTWSLPRSSFLFD